MGTKSTFLEDSILNAYLRNVAPVLPATVYLALLSADLPDDGIITTQEITGGSYARQAITFAASVGGMVSNSTAVTIPTMPACEITHFALCTALTAGNVLWYGPTSANIVLLAGETFDLPIAGLEVDED